MRLPAFIVLFCLYPFPPAGFRDQVDVKVPGKEVKVALHTYADQPIGAFFKSLVANHTDEFAVLDDDRFDSICRARDFIPDDSGNRATYYTLSILHMLFTAKTCQDGSRGEILNIPYYWHWIDPNPRHEILFTADGRPLTSLKHPAGFEKYATYADIDRTPVVFLTDLLSPVPRYCTAEGDTFSTFGWCSEREMAFISLITLMGYKGRVIAPGNHSWSEVDVSMKLKSGGRKNMVVTVDNTFDVIDWTGNAPGEAHSRYNGTAHSPSVLQRLRSFKVPSSAMNRIEGQVADYLRKKIAAR